MSTNKREEDTVISLYYEGYSREEISQKTKLSTGLISNYFARAKERSPGELKDIHKIGKHLRSFGISWPEVGSAISILNFCKAHGLDLEEIKDVLPSVAQKLNEHGLRISELPKDIENKVKQEKQLDLALKSKGSKLTEIQEKTELAVKNAAHTNESLARCRELTDFLKSHGLSLDAPEKLEKAIQHAEKAGFDGISIVNRISRAVSLEEQQRKLEEDLVKKKETLREQELKIEQLGLRYWKEKEAVDALETLQEYGVQTTDILSIKDLLEKEGSDILDLHNKTKLYCNLTRTNQQVQKEVQEFQKQKNELEPIVSSLKSNKEALESIIKQHLESIEKSMQSLAEEANNTVLKMSEAGDTSSAKIQSIGEKAEMVTKKYSRSSGALIFEPFIRTINGEQIDRKLLRDNLVFAMEIYRSRLPLRSPHNVPLEVLIKQLKDDIFID